MGREYSVTADQFRIKDTWEIFFSVLLSPYEPDCYRYQFVHTFSFFCLFKGQFLCQQLFLLFLCSERLWKKKLSFCFATLFSRKGFFHSTGQDVLFDLWQKLIPLLLQSPLDQCWQIYAAPSTGPESTVRYNVC